MNSLQRLITICGLSALALGTAIAPAVAKPIERGHFHDTETVVFQACGDLTLRYDLDASGSFLGNSRGPHGFAYGQGTLHGTESWTNVANGKSFTHVFNHNEKALKITDNGDGTLTVLIMGAGSDKYYGPEREYLFNDPGQTRWELLIDHAGTPTDPYDDEFVDFLGIVKGSTGRNDTQGRDFCDDLHEFIG